MSEPSPEQKQGWWVGPVDLALLGVFVVPVLGFLVALKVDQVGDMPLELSALQTLSLLRNHVVFYVGVGLGCAAVLLIGRRPLPLLAARLAIICGVLGLLFGEFLDGVSFFVSGTPLRLPVFTFTVAKLPALFEIMREVADPVVWIPLFTATGLFLAGVVYVADRWFHGPGLRRAPADERARWAARLFVGATIALLLSASPVRAGSAPRSMGHPLPVRFLIDGVFGVPGPPAGLQIDATYEQPVLTRRDSEQPPVNVVLVILETTRAISLTVYDPEASTTPWLAELAQDSLVGENTYVVVPRTSKSWMAIQCGIAPTIAMSTRESEEPGNIPIDCLPKLLADRGYDTVMFSSSTNDWEGIGQLQEYVGYADRLFMEDIDTDGFERANYFGFEDAVMLPPSRAWHEAHGNRPFLATYLTDTPHHDYLAPSGRYGALDLHPEDELNRYLNTLWYIDNFLQELVEQYKTLGLYDNTVFVFVGDHGEGFGEHRTTHHDSCPYEESVRVPLLVHAPGLAPARRVEGATSYFDVVPTVLDLLGYDLEPGALLGRSLLDPVDPQRQVFGSCWYDNACLFSVQGGVKLIHWYDDAPDELYDLSSDPGERVNLAEQRPEETRRRRAELIDWLHRTRGRYDAWLDGRHGSREP